MGARRGAALLWEQSPQQPAATRAATGRRRDTTSRTWGGSRWGLPAWRLWPRAGSGRSQESAVSPVPCWICTPRGRDNARKWLRGEHGQASGQRGPRAESSHSGAAWSSARPRLRCIEDGHAGQGAESRAHAAATLGKRGWNPHRPRVPELCVPTAERPPIPAALRLTCALPRREEPLRLGHGCSAKRTVRSELPPPAPSAAQSKRKRPGTGCLSQLPPPTVRPRPLFLPMAPLSECSRLVCIGRCWSPLATRDHFPRTPGICAAQPVVPRGMRPMGARMGAVMGTQP